MNDHPTQSATLHMRVEGTWRDEERSHTNKCFWYFTQKTMKKVKKLPSCWVQESLRRHLSSVIHSKMSEGENRITRWSYEDGVSPPNHPPSFHFLQPEGDVSHLFSGQFLRILRIFSFKDNVFNIVKLRISRLNAVFDQKSPSVKALLSTNLPGCSN